MTGVLGDAACGRANAAVPPGRLPAPREAARRSISVRATTLARRPFSAASNAARMLTVRSGEGVGSVGEGGGFAAAASRVAARYGVVGIATFARVDGPGRAGASSRGSSSPTSSHTESSAGASGVSARKCRASSAPMAGSGMTPGLASSFSKRARSARSLSPAPDIASAGNARARGRRVRWIRGAARQCERAPCGSRF
jgi:hypothetical protein